MLRRPIVLAVLLAGTAPVLAGSAAAQAPAAAAAARLRLSHVSAAVPASPLRSFVPADSIAPEKKKDHTLTGLLIGSAMGFVAGWAFYDAICEAVDNRCSDSRVGLVLLGTGVGGGLGALLGSLAQ